MTRGKSVHLFVSLAFLFSGASGLIYQTVWVRMLTRYLGATTHATATVLIVFMTGLCLGSMLAGRLADRMKRPLLGYVLLELAIGLTGLLASFAVIHGLGGYYVKVHQWVGDRPAALLAARVAFVLPCLLVPTVLMGATLPLMVSFVTRLGEHLQTGLGWLYGINTAGAVFGVLAAGFVLLGEFGETATLAVAAGLNGGAAVFALLLWRQQETPAAATPAAEADSEPVVPYPPAIRRLASLTLFISGLTALAYEILWTRLLVLVLKTSMYAFSTMLATFLLGIAAGSVFAAPGSKVRRAPLTTVAILELFIGLWTLVGMLALPHFFTPDPAEEAAGVQFELGGLACVFIILPVAFCFGTQFPAAVRCTVSAASAAGRATGRAYAVNTLGTIAGSVAAGFFLIPLFGTSRSLVLLAAVNVLLGGILLLAAPVAERLRRAPALAVGMAVLFAAVASFVTDPYRRVMTHLVASVCGPEGRVFDHLEGVEATTIPGGVPSHPQQRFLFVNGTNMTVLVTETKLMAHLPYLLAEQPRRMLIICAGMGTTMRSAARYPDLKVDVVAVALMT